MTSTIIPTPDTIPVHWIWFQLLLNLTFILHILLMNLAVGSSLLALWNIIRRKDPETKTKHLPTIIALTINLGVPPLLFVQVLFGNFFYSSSVMMAVYWILVIPILIIAYFCAYIFSRRVEKKPELARISIIVTTLLLLYIGFMFVNNSTLAIMPAKWKAYFSNPGGTLLNTADASLWPRYLHFMTAAVAVAALGKALWARYISKETNQRLKAAAINKNLKILGWATSLQFAIGTWFWLSMPGPVTKTFMGGSIIATILIVLVFISAVLIVFFAFKGNLTGVTAQVLFQVVLMTVVREITRSSYLSGIFRPSDLENVSQVSPLIVFLIVFVVGIAALYFMCRLTSKAEQSES